jgi:hypothetical protein
MGKDQRKWSIHEDITIITLSKMIGNKWTTISEHLENRTSNSVRNRWQRLQRAEKLKNGGHFIDRNGNKVDKFFYTCTKCSKPLRGHTCPY